MKDLARYSNPGSDSRSAAAEAAGRPEVRMLTIGPEDAGQRIDNFLLRICKGVPKSHVYQVLRSGQVRVNKGRIAQTYRLVEGDLVRVPPMRMAAGADTGARGAAGSASASGEGRIPAAEFPVLLEDDAILIIDKPAGVAVHGGSGVSFGVIEQLRAARPHAKFLELVHRLDRETSGVLVLAKKRSALVNLHEQIRDGGGMDKRYLALVHGDWQNKRQHVKLPLFKYTAADGERRVRVQADGLASHTVFNLLRKYGDYALLEAELKTGRTHQIRVHLASSGFPIVGDDKYGDFALNKRLQKAGNGHAALKRMFLHAFRLAFAHPLTGEPVSVEAPLPAECRRFLDSLLPA